MANLTVGGIRWVRNRDGGKDCPVERGVVITAQSGAIFTGDPVKRVNDGTFVVAAGGDTSISHVCIGVEQYKDSAGVIKGGSYLPNATAYSGAPSLSNPQASILRLVPVARQVFELDMNTAETSLTTAQTSVGNNIDVSVGTGSTTTGRSACVGANSSPGTGTANVRIIGIVQRPDNDVTAANWKAEVEFVEGTEPAPGSATGT
jgi:hypothetical protein